MLTTDPDFVLIACSGTKAADVDDDVTPDDELAAGDIYRGEAFKKSRKYAELKGLPWAVLSGKYGLLTPADRISDYDVRVQHRDQDEWREQVLAGLVDIDALLRPGVDVLVLAPTPYVDPIRDVLDDGLPIEWEAPLEGLRSGEMLSALNDLLEDVEGVSCNACGRRFPEDPVMAVSCPSCPAEPGQKCKRPSGWSGPFVHPHVARDKKAIAVGVTPPCPEGDDPMTPAEAAEELSEQYPEVECEVDDPADPYAYRWPADTAGVADLEPVAEPDAGVNHERRLLQTAIARVNQAEAQEQIEDGRPDWYLEAALECLRIAFDDTEAEPPFCEGCGVPKIAAPVSRTLNRGRKGGDVTSFICLDCDGQEDVPDDVDADAAASAAVCDGGTSALEYDPNPDDVHYDPRRCLAITGAGGEQCGSYMTPICGNHENMRDLARVDEFDEAPNEDLRDQLMEHCEFPGQRAYALAVLADDIEELWEIVTGLQDVSVGPYDWSGADVATWADKVAMHPNLDYDWSHPLAGDRCIAITGKDEQCPNGTYGVNLLCGTHFEVDDPDTVLERDGILDELREVLQDGEPHYVVEERGDDLVVITPDWELDRIPADAVQELPDDPGEALGEDVDPVAVEIEEEAAIRQTHPYDRPDDEPDAWTDPEEDASDASAGAVEAAPEDVIRDIVDEFGVETIEQYLGDEVVSFPMGVSVALSSVVEDLGAEDALEFAMDLEDVDEPVQDDTEQLDAGDAEDPTDGVEQTDDGPDPYDPATYEVDGVTNYDPGGPDVAGWTLTSIIKRAPTWKNGDGQYAKVVNQAGTFRAFAAGDPLNFGGSDLEGAIEAVVDWMQEHPHDPATYEDLDLAYGDVVRIRDTVLDGDTADNYLVTSTPTDNDSLDLSEVYVYGLVTGSRGAVEVDRINQVLVRAADKPDRPEQLAGIEEGDQVSVTVDTVLKEIGADVFGTVTQVAGGGWQVDEGGAGISIYVDVPDDVESLVVLEALRDAHGDWSEIKVAALDEDLHRTDYGALESIQVVTEDTISSTGDVVQDEEDDMDEFDEELWELRTRRLEEAGFSERQAEVVAAKEQGLTHEEIAGELDIGKYGIDTHSERARKKVQKARAILREAGDVYPEEE